MRWKNEGSWDVDKQASSIILGRVVHVSQTLAVSIDRNILKALTLYPTRRARAFVASLLLEQLFKTKVIGSGLTRLPRVVRDVVLVRILSRCRGKVG